MDTKYKLKTSSFKTSVLDRKLYCGYHSLCLSALIHEVVFEKNSHCGSPFLTLHSLSVPSFLNLEIVSIGVKKYRWGLSDLSSGICCPPMLERDTKCSQSNSGPLFLQEPLKHSSLLRASPLPTPPASTYSALVYMIPITLSYRIPPALPLCWSFGVALQLWVAFDKSVWRMSKCKCNNHKSISAHDMLLPGMSHTHAQWQKHCWIMMPRSVWVLNYFF